MADKLIWVLDLNAIRIHRCGRKVLEVVCHDDSGLATDGRLKNMSVTRIRKDCLSAKPRVSGNKTLWDSAIHQIPGASQPVECQIGSLSQDCPDPLVVDLLRPARPKEISRR